MLRIEEGGSDYVADFTDSCEIGAISRFPWHFVMDPKNCGSLIRRKSGLTGRR